MATSNAGASGTPGRPCGCPDVRTGYYDGDADGDGAYSKVKIHGSGRDYAGSTGNQPQATAPPGSSTNNQPRPEDFM